MRAQESRVQLNGEALSANPALWHSAVDTRVGGAARHKLTIEIDGTGEALNEFQLDLEAHLLRGGLFLGGLWRGCGCRFVSGARRLFGHPAWHGFAEWRTACDILFTEKRADECKAATYLIVTLLLVEAGSRRRRRGVAWREGDEKAG